MPASSASSTTQKTPIYKTAAFVPATDDQGKPVSKNAADLKKVVVHFNPATLDISYNNSVKKGKKKLPAQLITETTAKLSMELVFDTTTMHDSGDGNRVEAGKDVRKETNKLALMVNPTQFSPGKKKVKNKQMTSIVKFVWGPISFQGYIDSYKEKLEYFSAEGIPLRATVTISMTQQQPSIDDATDDTAAGLTQGNDLGTAPRPQSTPAQPPQINPGEDSLIKNAAAADSATDTAQRLGDPRNTHELAKQNGIENIRYPEVDQLVFSDSLMRSAPDMVASSRMNAAVGAEVQLGDTERLFSSLQNQASSRASLTPRSHFSFETGDLEDQIPATGLAGGFGIGGEMDAGAGGSMVADVGVDLDFEPGILFEE
jgi:hypothetical protein